MSREITVKDGEKIYIGKVARITRTFLGTEDHGILTAYLHVEGSGWGVGVGGYGLDKPVEVDGKFTHREPTAFGLDQIVNLYQTVGVSSWEDVVGQQVMVLFTDPWGPAVGIAHITDETKVFILAEHAEAWR